jgi:CHAT domain-containing protein/Tfp pilus assembly protein PilF
MKIFTFCSLFFLFCCQAIKYAECQNRLYYQNADFISAVDDYRNGRFEESKEKSCSLLHHTSPSDTLSFVPVVSLLGNLELSSGNYDSALFYFKLNIDYLKQKESDRVDLSSTLNNLAIVYNYQGNWIKALDYYEQALLLLNNDPETQKEHIGIINSIYYNMAIVYSGMKNYEKAKAYYFKCIDLINQYRLEDLDRVYYNLARIFEKLKDYEKAERYFVDAIEIRAGKYGEDYYRMASLYLYYGNLLRQMGKYPKASYYLTRAMNIYRANYGQRHPFISEALVLKAKYDMDMQQTDSAIVDLQNALIADSRLFNSDDLRHNPTFEDGLSAMQLLKALKFKSYLLYQSASKKTGNNRNTNLLIALNTVNVAVTVLKNIKKGYVSNENKLMLSNEIKEVFSIAVLCCIQLHRSTDDPKYAEYAFMYASAAKANLLFENMADGLTINKFVSTPEINKKKNYERIINSYKKKIYEESERAKPDSLKTDAWKGKLFVWNERYESYLDSLKKKYRIPEKRDYSFPSTELLKTGMDENTSLLEYFISKEPDSEKKNLVIFVLNQQGLHYFQKEIGLAFFNDLETFRKHMQFENENRSEKDTWKSFTDASRNLYTALIEPVKPNLTGQNLYIVPDDEIAYISFDALICEPVTGSTANYASLHYLIADYCCSYLHSSTMFLNRTGKKDRSDQVHAFAPDYSENPDVSSGNNPARLKQIKKETESIARYFICKTYNGQSASEDTFKMVAKKGGILHIAGHAFSEEDQLDFSYLAFSDFKEDEEQNGKLYAYEIGEIGIRSPMVVLSACNTGRGKLYTGEGMISLSRNFILAGVPAVVHSLWEVNDDSGNMIMEAFYHNLSKGYSKKEALRNAKLNYISVSSPAFVDPKFWAAYILTGDDSPIVKPLPIIYKIVAVLTLIALLSIVILKIRKARKVY